MPEQLLPELLQSQDSWGIWGIDPILAMVLAFTVVPLALAILILTLGSLGRLLCRADCDPPATALTKNRFAAHQRQSAGRLHRRGWTAPAPNANAVSPLRHRPGARRTRVPRGRSVKPPPMRRNLCRKRFL